MPKSKFEDTDSGLFKKVKDDPYEELFADCTSPEDVLQLQRDIESAEASDG